jgi:hypothetical protein
MEEHIVILELDGNEIECLIRVDKRKDGSYLVEDIYGVVNGELHWLNLKLLYKAQELYDKKGEAK